jgi:polyvinyl alcohol dehydrogenase (cytochrome)
VRIDRGALAAAMALPNLSAQGPPAERRVPLQGPAARMAALKLVDGSQAWLTRVEPADPGTGGRPRKGLTAAVTAIPGVVFAGGWHGVLHQAFSTADGHELWRFNAAKDFQTVNGVAGKGGSWGDPGPVIVGGVLSVGSSYIGTGNGMLGNVLLAFGIE